MKKYLLFAAVLLLAGCAPKADSVGDVCWSESTKTQIHDLAMRMVIDQAVQQYRDYVESAGIAPKGDGTSERETIGKNLAIVMHNFFVRNGDIGSGHYTCGAQAQLTFHKGDEAMRSDEQIVEFEIVHGESGQNVISNGAQWFQLLHAALDEKK